MAEEYEFSAEVYLREASPKAKKRTQEKLVAFGFRVSYDGARDHFTIRCSNVRFEKIFLARLVRFRPHLPSGKTDIEYCKTKGRMVIPANLRSDVFRITIPPLPIKYQK